jgi:hypothetical protein
VSGDCVFVAQGEDEKASAGASPAGEVARAGPSGARSDGDERALGRASSFAQNDILGKDILLANIFCYG